MMSFLQLRRPPGSTRTVTRFPYRALFRTGRAAAKASGASFHSIEGEELARWQAATAGVTEAWIAEMNAAGKDGEALVDDARALIAKYARSEEHTSELQSLMRISYAVFCLKKKKLIHIINMLHDMVNT